MTQGADNWTDATSITPGYTSDPTPTAGLTMESGEPNPSKSRTAWWKFTATSTRQLIIDLSQSIYPGDPFDADTYLSIFTGSTVDALTLVASDDDGAGVGYLSRLVFKNPVAGTTYYVQAALYTTADDIDYVLTFNEASPGEWQDDADVEWHTTASTQAGSQSQRVEGQGGTWQAAGDAAWSGTPSFVGAADGASELIFSDGTGGIASAIWRHTWATLSRTGDGGNTVASTSIPTDSPYYTDAHVVGIEWETASAPVSQRLTVRIANTSTQGVVLPADPLTFAVKAAPGYGSTSPYAPGGQSLGTVLGMSTLGTITTTASGGTLVVTDPAGLPLVGDFSLPVSAVDPFTASQTAPPHSGSAYDIRYPIRATLEGGYRPRYRLIYDTPAPPPPPVATRAPLLRKYPLDIGRKWPPSKAQQYGGRRVGGYQ